MDLALEGEIDVSNADVVKARLAEAIDADPGGTIRVDLEAVTFLDSTALGAIIGALRRARANGGDIELVKAQPKILRVFTLTGLDKVIGVSPA
jgi:anti-sigma B factor antagonist